MSVKKLPWEGPTYSRVRSNAAWTHVEIPGFGRLDRDEVRVSRTHVIPLSDSRDAEAIRLFKLAEKAVAMLNARLEEIGNDDTASIARTYDYDWDHFGEDNCTGRRAIAKGVPKKDCKFYKDNGDGGFRMTSGPPSVKVRQE